MTVLEPSCGNGAFLVEIASRLIESIRLHSPSRNIDSLDEEISAALSRNIMAIEIDGEALEKAKNRVLSMLEERYSYRPMDADSLFDSWHAGDAIEYLQTDGTRYDFIVGNPPYIRIHNVGDVGGLREIPWCSSGMTDMFYAFYYLGLNHLNDNGTLAYIAPSVWMTSKYGKAMRGDLIAGGNVKTVIDHGDDQLFDGVSAYVATTVLTAERNESIEYSSPSVGKLTVPQDEAWIGGKLMPIADGETREAFREIADGSICNKSVFVRTGFQTGNDALFLDEAGRFPDVLKIDVVKSSTGAMGRMFFPLRCRHEAAASRSRQPRLPRRGEAPNRRDGAADVGEKRHRRRQLVGVREDAGDIVRTSRQDHPPESVQAWQPRQGRRGTGRDWGVRHGVLRHRYGYR